MNKKLWYNSKAEVWEEALPIGNGKIGAMVFSGTSRDTIQITEETLWSGRPNMVTYQHNIDEIKEIRELVDKGEFALATKKTSESMCGAQSQAFNSYGNIFIDVSWLSRDVSDYRRELDLETGVVKTTYVQGNREFTKEYFSSLADDVIVVKIKASKPSHFHIYQAVELENTTSCDIEKGIVTAIGKCPTDESLVGSVVLHEKDKESIHFCSRIKLITDDIKYFGGNSLWVEKGTELMILFSLKTSFNGYDKMPVSEGKEYIEASLEAVENASKYSYEELKERHIEKYKSFFDRVDLKIDGEDFDNIPTDERIKRAGDGAVDNGLVSMLFDFSRYLLISSSQPETQPINLQGIWNHMVFPLWRSNYTMNINTEMNYWTAETVNLPECHMPLLEMLKDFAKKGNNFGFRGWSAWHNTDIWRFNHEATTGVLWGYWQMGGFWIARHIWEHYLHTRDINFLKEYYPIMVGATEFLEDWMYEDKDGKLKTCPSTSPENEFFDGDEKCAVYKGSAMDMAIIYDVFDKTIKIADILGENSEHFRKILSKLAPVKIGKDGRILEWGEELPECEFGHRHISHLYGFYPADVLKGEEYEEAVRKSLDFRLEHGGGHTGWSNAWIANVFARLKNSEKVMEHIRNMFKKSIFPNLFDSHPPFQIDGNFGIASAICEALIQDHNGSIELIPAIPDEWESGEVHGFVTRTGEIIDFKWKNKKAEIISVKPVK